MRTGIITRSYDCLVIFISLFLSGISGACVRPWPMSDPVEPIIHAPASQIGTLTPGLNQAATPSEHVEQTPIIKITYPTKQVTPTVIEIPSTEITKNQLAPTPIETPTAVITSNPFTYFPLIYRNSVSAAALGTVPSLVSSEFSLSDAHERPPEDVLEEVFYGATGGGGWCPLVTEPPNPPLHQILQLTDHAMWSVCGWENGEAVDAVVERPDNRSDHFTLMEGEPEGVIRFSYPTLLIDPPGWYRVTLSGRSGSIEAFFYFKPVSEPRLYTISSDRLLFYGFSPHEVVRLFAYGSITDERAQFAAWQEYQVGPDGRLELFLQNSMPIYFAIGSVSGEVRLYPNGEYLENFNYLGSSIQERDCSTGRRASYRPGDFVRPIYANWRSDGTYDLAVDLDNYENDVEIQAGDRLKVLEGPVCYKGVLWRVQTDLGTQGWMDEQDLEMYPSLDTACANTPLPRMSPDRQGRVTFTDGRSLLIHTQPRLKAKIIDRLPEGEVFFSIEGPRCNDGYYWWHIQRINGMDGWIAEGDNHFYFIEPLPDYFIQETPLQ